MSDTKKLAEALKRYGEGAATSLEKMRSDIREAVQSAPPWLDELAGDVSRFMPGVGLVDSVRMGSEAGGLWRQGRYADSLDRFADAVHAPMGEIFWVLPGGGAAKKVHK